jgi:hypothetical protein
MSTRIVRTAMYGSLNIVLLAGCAGPMSPFGAIDGWQSKSSIENEDKAAAWNGRDTRVRFFPARQVLHGPTAFSIIIEDPEGVPEDYRLKLTYNGIDVSSKFLARAEQNFLDPDHRRMRLNVNHVRILATRDNRVTASYWHAAGQKPVIAKYMPPVCPAFEGSRSLASIPDFDPPPLMLQMINQQAISHGLNPYYVAGLIAQESGFDPQAVSHARALGLTQVTSLGAAEVVKFNDNWPRYPGIDEMSIPMLRMSVLNGKINSTNEWRLNPALSILGGIEYLAYLNDYWSRPDKKALLESKFEDPDSALSEVMLASYNSGAYRVSAALEDKGKKYLQEEDLSEARKYVRRVTSYCDYFANKEE